MTADDLEQVLKWRNHPDIRRHMFTAHEISMDEHRDWFLRNTRDTRKHLLILDCAGVGMGFVSFSESSLGKIADWGFYAAPDAVKGTGRMLGFSALRYAFEDLALYKVCGLALAGNDRSIGLHRALGFKEEGVLRSQHFDGEQYHDIVCFGLLRTERLVQR